MRNLRTYFDIQFDEKEISDNELRTFAEDHLRRLAGNDPDNRFGDLLAATTATYTAFFGAISDEDAHTAVREGLTKTKDVALANFKAAISRREGTIRGEFGKESSEYQEFFPHGVTEYTTATLENVETLMKRMVTGATKYKTQLGQGFLDEFAALQSAFMGARDAQIEKKGAVSGSKTEAANARKALEKQLTTNVLTLALAFLGQPQAGISYFDQSLLREDEKSVPKPPTT